jgi:hypothetical protein
MSKDFDFSRFSSPEIEEEGIEVAIDWEDGTPSGLVIRAAGPNSPRRKAFARSLLDRKLTKGQQLASVDIEEAELGEMVAATISWRHTEGAKLPDCNAANVRDVYTKHPSIMQQVKRESAKLVNFTRKPGAT